jgi:flagellin-like hook-associated protein FlgL
MSAVTLSAAVRSNLLSLQNTAALLDTTQTRLATGNKVNSALDNPTSYFTASSLNSRASDLGNLLDGVSNAIQTIQAASDGISSITKLVQSAQATANQAQQLSETTGSGAASAVGTTTIGSDGTAVLTGSVDMSGNSALGLSTGYQNTSLTLDVGGTNITFDFYNLNNGAYSGSNIGIDTDDGTTMNPQPMALGLAAMQAGLRASGVAGTADATVGLDGNGHLQITLGSDTTTSLSVVSDTTASGIADGGDGLGFGLTAGQTASPNPALANLSGTLTIADNTLTFGSGASQINSRAELVAALGGLTGGVTGSIDGSNHLTFSGSGSTPFTIGGTLDVNAAFGIVEQTYNGGGANPARGALISQYIGLLDQIDQLTKDAGYNGNNLLAGASTQLKVVFNETGTSSLTVAGKDTSATGLGLAQLAGTDFDTNASITSILATLKAAADTLRSDASSFGSNLSIVQTRQDFTKALINTLQTGASNLTLADSNEEAAVLLALQTRQSLSTKALSLASQGDQNVLRLLQ